MKENSKSGIVYVLSNPAMPSIIKIGITTRDNLDDRMKELYTTGVPVPFKCEYACKVEDCSAVESALHQAFDPQRINPQREFFSINPEQAIGVLKLLSIEEITEAVAEEIKKTVNEIDISAGKKLQRKKRPRFNFAQMGIPVGSQLQWSRGSEVATVVNETLVRYNEAEMSLTSLTSSLLGTDYNVQPLPYWTYNGRSLSEFYNETYTFDEENE